jgi:hypothetical protein
MRNVYVLCPRCGGEHGRRPCKIGASDDPERRRREIQIGSPEPLDLVHVEPVDPSIARGVERSAREIAVERGGRRLIGEWVETTPHDARESVKTAHERLRTRKPKQA